MDMNGGDMSGDDFPDARTCPNIQHLLPEKVRRPLRNLVDGVCPRKELKRRLKAVDFQVTFQNFFEFFQAWEYQKMEMYVAITF